MVIFLTGGTGFVGRAVTQQLVADGHQVRVLRRPHRRPPPPRASSVSHAPGIQEALVNPWDSAALAPAMNGVDAVVHLVGIIGEWGDQTFDRVHVQLTGILLEAARLAGVRRWIHMSALGTRANANARYHQTKWQAEQLVLNAPIHSTIFRPSIIYGAEDQFTHMFARISAWSPFVPVIGTGRNLLQPIAVEQVAQAFARAAARPETNRHHYDLAGPERLSLSTIVQQILQAHRRHRFLLHFPRALARMQAALLEAIWPLLANGPAPLTRDQLLMLQEDNVGEPEPADRDFSLAHHSFAAGISRFFPAAPRSGKSPP